MERILATLAIHDFKILATLAIHDFKILATLAIHDFKILATLAIHDFTGPRSAVGNVSGNRCVSDCRIRGREFNLGPVPYFPGD